jgi:hypothetical protein
MKRRGGEEKRRECGALFAKTAPHPAKTPNLCVTAGHDGSAGKKRER